MDSSRHQSHRRSTCCSPAGYDAPVTLSRLPTLALGFTFLGACSGPTEVPKSAMPAASAPNSPPLASPSPSPSPSVTAAPIAPPPVDPAKQQAAIEQAEKLARATAEVTWLENILHGQYELASKATCDAGGCDVRVDVNPETGTFFSFLAPRAGGLQALSPEGQPTPYDAWSKEMARELADIDKAAEAHAKKISLLPEIKSFFGKVKANRRSTALWLEMPPKPLCHTDEADCRFVFYIGEIGMGHASRYATAFIGRATGKMWLSDLVIPEPTPYEEWKREKR